MNHVKSHYALADPFPDDLSWCYLNFGFCFVCLFFIFIFPGLYPQISLPQTKCHFSRPYAELALVTLQTALLWGGKQCSQWPSFFALLVCCSAQLGAALPFAKDLFALRIILKCDIWEKRGKLKQLCISMQHLCGNISKGQIRWKSSVWLIENILSANNTKVGAIYYHCDSVI